MKSLLIFAFIFCLAFNTRAQYNLQLNQVKTYTGTLTSPQEERVLDTVPQGKVWKIEAIGLSGGPYYQFKINGKNYFNIWDPGVNAGSRAGGVIKEIIWLKAGDIITAKNSLGFGSCPYGCNQDYVISILEFNLIQ